MKRYEEKKKWREIVLHMYIDSEIERATKMKRHNITLHYIA